MPFLGQIIGRCGQDTPHTGAGFCPKKEGKTVAIILTGPNAFYEADPVKFVEELSAHVTAIDSKRMYPIKGVVGMPISGGDINAPELGVYGGATPEGLNAKNIAYQIDGGDCLYKELAKTNKRKMRIFHIDDEGFIYGTVVVRDGKEYFAGFEITVYAVRVRTDGSTAYNLSLYAYYSVNNESEEKNMFGFEVGLANIPDGLVGVILKTGAAAGTVQVVTACGGEDITPEYGPDWTPAMFINDSGIQAATVSYGANGMLTIAPAGKYRVASSAVLATGDILGLEGLPQLTQIPGA